MRTWALRLRDCEGHQILATGYVGAPAGLPHCDDVGHQMRKMLHEDGTITEHCVRTVHAEQNAYVRQRREAWRSTGRRCIAA